MPSSGVLPLSTFDLVIAASLVFLAGAISLALRLGLEKRLAIAALRTVVQLTLVGQILAWVFAIDRAWILLLVLTVMIAAAGRAAISRSSRTYSGAYFRAFAALAVSSLITIAVVTQVVIGIEPWYRPQYVIPLVGMILGNSLTGISLCLDHLLETLDSKHDEVETALALGATAWEAAREPVAEAVRRGMIPMINAMTVAGIVSLPGMMTGQILQGASPLDAVKYQIVVMFMLAASTALGSVGVAGLTFRKLFNARHQLVLVAILKRD